MYNQDLAVGSSRPSSSAYATLCSLWYWHVSYNTRFSYKVNDSYLVLVALRVYAICNRNGWFFILILALGLIPTVTNLVRPHNHQSLSVYNSHASRSIILLTWRSASLLTLAAYRCRVLRLRCRVGALTIYQSLQLLINCVVWIVVGRAFLASARADPPFGSRENHAYFRDNVGLHRFGVNVGQVVTALVSAALQWPQRPFYPPSKWYSSRDLFGRCDLLMKNSRLFLFSVSEVYSFNRCINGKCWINLKPVFKEHSCC